METEDLVSSHLMPLSLSWAAMEKNQKQLLGEWPIPLPCAPCPLSCAPGLLHSLLSICMAFSPSPPILTSFMVLLLLNLLHGTLWAAPSVSYFITFRALVASPCYPCSRHKTLIFSHPSQPIYQQQLLLTLLPNHILLLPNCTTSSWSKSSCPGT